MAGGTQAYIRDVAGAIWTTSHS